VRFWTRFWAELLLILSIAGAGAAGESPSVESGGQDAASRAVGEAQPDALTLPELMAGFARATGLRAHFVERKTLALLVEPLESEGWLYFVPPDRLARHVEKPWSASMVIHGDRLFMRDPSGSEQLDLAQSDVARRFVESFIVLFSGDHRELERRYEVAFVSGPEGWRIDLVPRSRKLRRLIASVHLQGRGIALLRMELVESQGDRSETRFDRIDPYHEFDADALREIFSMESPASPGAPSTRSSRVD
jgi:hypothetical protein